MSNGTKDNLNRQTDRQQYMDIAKGIGILCVIAGHMGVNIVKKMVYPFHMPLFFLISGYFISTKKSFGVYAKDKTKSLLLPYVFTSVCLCILAAIKSLMIEPNSIYSVIKNWGINAFYGCGSNDCKLPLGINQIGAIWFLLALLWALLLVKYLIKFRFVAIYLIFIALASYFSAEYIWLPFSIQAGGMAAIFVYVGCLVRKYSILKKPTNKLILVIGGIVWCFECVSGNVIYMVQCYYSNGIFSMIAAILICYLVVFISKSLADTKIGNIFAFYGKYSLVVLCFHLIELEMAPWRLVTELFNSVGLSNYIAIVPIFVLKVLFCTACIFICLNISYIGRIFGITDEKKLA